MEPQPGCLLPLLVLVLILGLGAFVGPAETSIEAFPAPMIEASSAP
jgi:hypothetical protein